MRLEDWLTKNEVTQAAFAKAVGVTQGRIGQLVHGDLPSMQLAIRIKDATEGKVRPDDFIRDHRSRRRAAA